MSYDSAFELSRDVAATPGKVVFQNELIQLIQYDQTTSQVPKRPLLVMPAWINKFYVFDLQPKNSSSNGRLISGRPPLRARLA